MVLDAKTEFVIRGQHGCDFFGKLVASWAFLSYWAKIGCGKRVGFDEKARTTSLRG